MDSTSQTIRKKNSQAVLTALIAPTLIFSPLGKSSFRPKTLDLLQNAVIKIGRKVKVPEKHDNGIFDSKVLSRIHAEVYWSIDQGKVLLKDVGSSNGTFLNGVRLSEEGVASQPFELNEEDVIEFGIDIMDADNVTVLFQKVCCRVSLLKEKENLPPSSAPMDNITLKNPKGMEKINGILDQELVKSKQTNLELELVKTTLISTIQDLKEKNDTTEYLQQRLTEQREEATSLQIALDFLTEKYETQDKIIKDSKIESDNLKSTVKTLQQTIESLNMASPSSAPQNGNAESDLKRLEALMVEERARVLQETELLLSKNVQISIDYELLLSEKDQVSLELHDLKKEVESKTDESLGEFLLLKEENLKLKNGLVTWQGYLEEALLAKKVVEEDLLKLKGESLKMDLTKCSDFELQILKLTDEVLTLNSNSENFKLEILKFKDENANLYLKSENLKLELVKLKNENTRLVLKGEDLESEIVKLTNLKESKESDLKDVNLFEDLSFTNAFLVEENVELKQKLEGKALEIANWKKLSENHYVKTDDKVVGEFVSDKRHVNRVAVGTDDFWTNQSKMMLVFFVVGITCGLFYFF